MLGQDFGFPVLGVSAPGNPNQMFVVEKAGNIRILDLTTGAINSTPFLSAANLAAGNGLSTSGEQGLLGLAFDPNYQSNRRFYVNYTDGSGNTRIRSYQSQLSNVNQTDISSESEILQIAQPFSNHNGGWIGFGPDQNLYIGTGDGGSGNDPNGNALNRNDPTNFSGTNYNSLIDWTNYVSLDFGSLGNITSFAEDANGNLYLINSGGNIYRFAAGAVPEPGLAGMLAILGILARIRRNRTSSDP